MGYSPGAVKSLRTIASKSFNGVSVCICGVVLVRARSSRVPSVCVRSPFFALVQPRVLSIRACLTFGRALLPPHVTLVEPRATVMISLIGIIVYGTKHTIFDGSSR